MIGVLSINYKKANLKIREQFCLSNTEIPEFYSFFQSKYNFDGLFVLSTCNRTEFYYQNSAGSHTHEYYTKKLLAAIYEFKSFEGDVSSMISFLYDLNAIKHFFAVVSGLKSMVFGEYQIVNQVKNAYELSKASKALGPTLEKMIHKAQETSKKIRTKTNISKGTLSVSSTAVEIALSKLNDPQKLKTLTVGTGETGQLVAQILKKKGCNNISLTNRTYSKAVDIAKLFNAEVIEYKNMYEAMPDMDMVVFSTSSKKPILDRTQMTEIMAKRYHQPILIIDVGVPRNVSNDIEEIEGVELLNLDKLKVIVEENMERKKGELTNANAILETQLNEFKDWLDTRQLQKTFAIINQSFDKIHRLQTEKFKDNASFSEIEEYGAVLSKRYSKLIIKHLLQVSKKGVDKETLNLLEGVFAFDQC